MTKRNVVTIALTGAVLAGAFLLTGISAASATPCAKCKTKVILQTHLSGPNSVSRAGKSMLNPQPLPPGMKNSINPQPLPPRVFQR